MPKRANYIQLPRITTNYNLSFCTQTQAALADRKMQNSLQQQTEFHAHHSVERPDATQKIGCFGLANRVNFVPSSISHRKPGFWCPVFDRICIVLGENPQCLRSLSDELKWLKFIPRPAARQSTAAQPESFEGAVPIKHDPPCNLWKCQWISNQNGMMGNMG